MNPTTLQNVVTEAVSLDREIRELTERLKELKGKLIQEATLRPDAERVATEGGGWSWTAPGNDGCIARVTAPAPKLRATLDSTMKSHSKLLDRFFKAGLTHCFSPRTVFDLAPDFRALVEAELPPAQATKLIEACETESSPRVEFETTERSA